MPYASEHLAYTFSGGLPGSEQWSVTLRTGNATATDAQCTDLATAAATAFVTFFTATGSWYAFNPAAVTFLDVTCRAISAAGITTAQGSAAPTTATHGESGTQGAPNQTALVVTLNTAQPGRSGRGRIYMPFLSPQFGVGTDQVPTSVQDQLITPTAAFITTMNDIATGSSGPFPISIQSKVRLTSVPAVNAVSIGSVVDTQRRRRNRVVEVYVSSGV